jgi:hypothetical protein
MLYLAMGDHLEPFRMQFPPMIAVLAQAARALPLDPLTAVTIIIGGTARQWEEYWGEVSEAARSSNLWGVDEEQSVPMFVCRRPRLDLPLLFRRVGPDWG